MRDINDLACDCIMCNRASLEDTLEEMGIPCDLCGRVRCDGFCWENIPKKNQNRLAEFRRAIEKWMNG